MENIAVHNIHSLTPPIDTTILHLPQNAAFLELPSTSNLSVPSNHMTL
jgi:hypothetical protein